MYRNQLYFYKQSEREDLKVILFVMTLKIILRNKFKRVKDSYTKNYDIDERN